VLHVGGYLLLTFVVQQHDWDISYIISQCIALKDVIIIIIIIINYKV
jgi:hypothetical protein